MFDKPKFADAPGIVVRPLKDGRWSVNWQAQTDIIKLGFRPKFRRITIVGPIPNNEERTFISDMASGYQSQMMQFVGAVTPEVGSFTGSVASLISCYESDPLSAFNVKLRFRSKKSYRSFMKRIVEDIGHERVADLDARRIMLWHQDLLKRGVPMAHGTVNIFRAVMTYGATLLPKVHREMCRSVREELADLKFEMGKPRSSILTAEQVVEIRRLAHARGLHSLALAQAIQFECMLRQRDVIGEWVPTSEPELSTVLDGNRKWLRGIRWEEITEEAGKLMLRHVTSKRLKLMEIDLRLAPMVMEEFELLGERPRSGPVIIYESTRRPYDENMFRGFWRKLATEAGIPKTVRNMDSRAGAISEATTAGAKLEHVRHAATHSDISTTQGYSRDGEMKTAEVLKQRVEYRKKKGNSAP